MNMSEDDMEELKWLRYLFASIDLGPADDAVFDMIREQYEEEQYEKQSSKGTKTYSQTTGCTC